MTERIKALSPKNSRGIAAAALLLVSLCLPILSGMAAPVGPGPAANAGLPQLVTVGATVRLDASLSTSSTGSALAYQWTFVSIPDGSAATLTAPTAVNPTFITDQPGSYVVQLAVSDGTNASTSEVVISTQTTPPVADAASNQIVTAGSVVHLDGSRSSDAEGDALTFRWTLTSQPATSRSSISNPASIAPTFLADVAGTYVAQLTVSDSHGNQSTATVTVSTQDVPPVARAGRTQSVAVGTTVQLDGSATSDPGGDALSYSWSIISRPAASTAALNSAATVNPTFVADVAGAYVAQLAVTDSHGNVSFSTVEVTTDAIPPVANAGGTQTVAPGDTVQLDGSKSAANNGAPLQYRWNLLAKPSGSSAALAGGGSSSTSSFTADLAGQYLVQLLVSDGTLTSAPSTVLIAATASGPNLVISPSPIKFGAQAPGTTSTAIGVTITNLGTAAVQVTNFLVAGINASEFAVRGLNPITLAPNTAFIFSVSFTPQALDTRTAALIIYDNTGGPPHVASLSGVGGTSIPGIQITPSSLAFPDQLVRTGSAAQSLTVTNTGTAPLQISGLTFGGSNPGDFVFPATFTPPTPASPINVAANGGTTTIPVIFKPTASGPRAAMLLTTDNASGSPHSAALGGNGTTGQSITVAPASINFPNQNVGTSSAPVPVTVTNPGTNPVQITALTFGGVNGADFSTTVTAPITLAAGGSTVTIPVTFKPGAAVLRSGNLTITDDSGGSAHTVALSGTGTAVGPGISMSPSPLNFANQALNTTTMLPLTVTDTGGTTVSVTGLLLAGINASDFGINGPRSFTLTPGGIGTINVQFTPRDLGSRTASLIVYDDTPGSPHAVTLTGVGGTSSPAIQLTPNPLNFPDQSVGTTSTALSVTAKNTGNATLQITGVSIGGINPGDYGFPSTFTPPTSASPINVAANSGTTLIPVIFKPTASGARPATLLVTDNASGSPHMVTLNGSGTSGQLPSISVTPTAMVFPDQAVGSSSAALPVTVTNASTTAVQITALTFGGANGAEFSSTLTAPITVAASGGTAIIPVIFRPGAAGLRSGNLTVTDNSGGSTHTVALSGNGIVPPPGISLSPSPLIFPNQGLNFTATLPLTVTNTGGTTVSVTGLLLAGIDGSQFSINGPRSFTLTPGNNFNINIQFTPQSEGTKTAALIVNDDTGGQAHAVQLSGKGVAAAPLFAANPTSLPFVGQEVGTTSAPLSVTITNSGTAPLQITGLSFNGTNPADFGFPAGFTLPTAAAPISVANNGGTTTIPVVFKPTASGARAASLQFADNASNNLPHSVSVSGTGTQAVAVVGPTSVAFGNQDVNTTSNPSSITVTNTGTVALKITAITFGGSNPADFALPASFTAPTPASPITVAPGGGATTVPVIFKPTTQGARTAKLMITDNAADTPQSAALSGTGVGPTVVFNPANVSFGDQMQNVASAVAPFSISNTGNADLQITGISITGANAADFSFPAGFTPPTPAAPMTVPPNGVVNLGASFTPGATGARTGAVSVADNAPNSPQALPLSGNGTLPKAILSATTINFPNQGKDTTSAAQVITLSNTGTAPLTITSFSFTGTNPGDFTTTAAAQVTVPPNGSTNISVTFTPSAIGDRSATLQINDNAIPNQQTVTLLGKGVGVPIPNIAPPSLNFGTQPDNQQSSALTLTISNIGTADLVISTMSILGANASDFSYGIVGGGSGGFGDFPETIPPNGSLGVNVYFNPSAGGQRNASLAIFDNAAGSPQQVPVTGFGIATPPTAILDKTSLSFADQPVNTTSAPQSITITNNGQTDLSVSSVSISGANASDFRVTPTGPFTVTKNGGTATLSVTFTPSGLNARGATLAVVDNAANSPQSVPLSGAGRGQGQISLPPISLGGNLEMLATASLDVAPSSALPVTITSSDPTKVLLVTLASDPNGATQGTAQVTGTVPAGQGRLGFGFPGFWVQALASSGTAQITITAPGYLSASATVTLTPSGFVLSGPAGTGTNFFAILGANSSLTVSAVQLDTSGNVLSASQKLRGGVVANVTVNSDTLATGTIAGNPAVVQPGTTTSSVVTFQTNATGTSSLSATQPAGYSAPASGARLTVTVNAPSISLNPVTIGFNQQTVAVGRLNLAAASAMSVNVTSSDPSKVLLTTNPAAVGTGSITLALAAGATSLPPFYIQALASSGVVTLTASATGYSSGTGNVALNPSAFLLNGPNGTANFSTTTISPATNLTVTLWQLDPSRHPQTPGLLRPGDSESVTVASGTLSTGSITGSPALFAAGDNTNTNLTFQPAQNCSTPCTSVLSVAQPAGFSTPASGGQFTVTVNQPSLMPRLIETTIGGNLEVPAAGALDAPAPNNLPVTITSNNPNVVLSTSPGALGTQSITVTVPTGSGVNSIGFPTYYVQALANSGTAQLTASAPGFTSGTITVSLAPAGFVISGPNGVGTNFGTLLGNGSVNLTVSAVVLDPATLTPTQILQPVRGGVSASVTVVSDSAAAVVSGSPVIVAAGNASGAVTLQLQTTGVANITVSTPSGFTTPSFGAQLSATIN